MPNDCKGFFIVCPDGKHPFIRPPGYAFRQKKNALHIVSCKALLFLFEGEIGGREGDRTLGPRIANAVLSQLSYSPPVVLKEGLI